MSPIDRVEEILKLIDETLEGCADPAGDKDTAAADEPVFA